jgi:hypothetical protein
MAILRASDIEFAKDFRKNHPQKWWEGFYWGGERKFNPYRPNHWRSNKDTIDIEYALLWDAGYCFRKSESYANYIRDKQNISVAS